MWPGPADWSTPSWPSPGRCWSTSPRAHGWPVARGGPTPQRPLGPAPARKRTQMLRPRWRRPVGLQWAGTRRWRRSWRRRLRAWTSWTEDTRSWGLGRKGRRTSAGVGTRVTSSPAGVRPKMTGFLRTAAPVAQRIERRPPEAKALVRFQPGALVRITPGRSAVPSSAPRLCPGLSPVGRSTWCRPTTARPSLDCPGFRTSPVGD